MRASLRCVASCAVLLFVAGGAIGASAQPNIVLIITDDQRIDTLWAMPLLQQRLQANGRTFNNAFVTIPWCCPSRSGFLSGGYRPENTLVHNNGGETRFNNADTLATRVQAQGYKTAMIGKYFNNYGVVTAPEIPAGWDYFVGVTTRQPDIDWFDFEVAIGSSGAQPGIGVITQVQQYITYHQRDEALAFLDTVGSDPFFLYFSTNAIHGPYTPAPEDQGAFSDYAYSDPALQEVDLSDKPQWVQDQPRCGPGTRPGLELASLQAVDRAVDAIYTRLEQQGKLDNTYFIFTSDHGNLWGEHGQCFKGKPYEPSLRVPLVVSGVDVVAGSEDRMVIANLDLPRTVAELAGAAMPSDGENILPLMQDEVVPGWRDTVLAQTFSEPIWSGLRVSRADGEWKYVEWGPGDIEFYNLALDPYELESAHDDPQYAALRAEFAATLAVGRGLSFREHGVPDGVVGQPYNFVVPFWSGSAANAEVQFLNGTLPPGLGFVDGTIVGTPSEAGCFLGRYKVVSELMATHANALQVPQISYTLCVLDDADGDGVNDLLDNCTLAANPDQRDSNGDGYGNVCDADLDNDGAINAVDLGLLRLAFFSADPDADFNGDGVVNVLDLGVLKLAFFGAPGPAAGQP